MSKKSFLTGIFIAPILLGGYWLYNSSPKAAPPSDTSPALTLLDLNYAPTTPPTPFPSDPFYALENGQKTAISIGAFSGKPVIVHFWATWCFPCTKEMPDLNAFSQTHGKDIAVIALVSDTQSAQAVEKFYTDQSLTSLKIYVDDNGLIARQLRISSLPTSLFINAQGNLVGRITGPVDWTGKAGLLLKSVISQN